MEHASRILLLCHSLQVSATGRKAIFGKSLVAEAARCRKVRQRACWNTGRCPSQMFVPARHKVISAFLTLSHLTCGQFLWVVGPGANHQAECPNLLLLFLRMEPAILSSPSSSKVSSSLLEKLLQESKGCPSQSRSAVTQLSPQLQGMDGATLSLVGAGGR